MQGDLLAAAMAETFELAVTSAQTVKGGIETREDRPKRVKYVWDHGKKTEC